MVERASRVGTCAGSVCHGEANECRFNDSVARLTGETRALSSAGGTSASAPKGQDEIAQGNALGSIILETEAAVVMVSVCNVPFEGGPLGWADRENPVTALPMKSGKSFGLGFQPLR